MFNRHHATKFKIMKKEKVRSNYEKLTDYELATLGGRVVRAMQETSTADFFTDPQPSMEDLESFVTDYVEKHEIASRRGSALEISMKNESRENVLLALRTLANYVNEKARGHMSKLLSTGLQLVSQPGRIDVPSVPQEIKLKDGALSGQIKVSFKRAKNVWMYDIQLGTEAPPGEELDWGELYQTTVSRGTVIGNLTIGQRYYVRVRALNGKGAGDWSQPISMLVR